MTYSKRRESFTRSLDYGVLVIYLTLLAFGWLTLQASIYQESMVGASVFDFSTSVGKHTAWIVVALVVLIITLLIDWQLWNTFAYVVYGITIVLLLLVLFVGTEIKGARSWFSFGAFSIQPSEFAKFGTALALSSYLSHFSVDLRYSKALWTSLGIIGLPMLLILLQPDAGSAIVFLSFFILFYVKGLSPIYYIYGFSLLGIFIIALMYGPMQVMIAASVLGIVSLMREQLAWRYVVGATAIVLIGWYLSTQQGWSDTFTILTLVGVVGLGIWRIIERQPRLPMLVFVGLVLCAAFAYGSNYAFHTLLKPHQQDRINVWLRPENCDPQGSLYNVLQSKLAIGSGGFSGKGHLQGTMTKLNFVPEQSTDFIFSIVGEEQGFLGAILVIGLFVALLVRIVWIAERAKTAFVRCYAYAVAGLFFVHMVVNIGMSVGLMPIIGIPLPFLSKGGSALIVFTMLLGVLLRMDLVRNRR